MIKIIDLNTEFARLTMLKGPSPTTADAATPQPTKHIRADVDDLRTTR